MRTKNNHLFMGCTRCVWLVIMVLSSLIFFCVPAFATENQQTYEISIELFFSDSETIEHGIEDFQDLEFLIQDSDGMYLVAEYDQEAKSYRIIGRSDVETVATRFQGGMDPEKQSQLKISGLAAGKYVIDQIGVTEGYALILDGIDVEICSEWASVDGHMLEESFDGRTVCFQVQICRPWRLPGPNPMVPIMQSIGFFVLIVAAVILIVVWKMPTKDN